MKESVIDDAIKRVREMEKCFDLIKADPGMKEALKMLTDYLESGLWLHDYELDEKGLLPKDLKRGVLAQDSLYNLLTEIKYMDLQTSDSEI